MKTETTTVYITRHGTRCDTAAQALKLERAEDTYFLLESIVKAALHREGRDTEILHTQTRSDLGSLSRALSSGDSKLREALLSWLRTLERRDRRSAKPVARDAQPIEDAGNEQR